MALSTNPEIRDSLGKRCKTKWDKLHKMSSIKDRK
jgi:hypothetical protein